MDIRHEGCWAHQSKAFDVYARSDLVAIPPSDIYNQYEKYRKKWTSARLKHLLQVVVKTPRHKKDQPHAAVLKSQFPSTQKDLCIELPRIYPHTKSAFKLAAAKEAREKEIFLKLQEKEQEWHNYISKKRKTLASIRRRETTKRRAIIGPKPAVVIPPANVPAEISREIMTQTYISVADKMCQTTPVRIVEEPLIVDSENKIVEMIHLKALVLVPGTSEKVTISLKGRTSSMVRTDGSHQKENRGPSKAAKAKRNIRLKIRRRVDPHWNCNYNNRRQKGRKGGLVSFTDMSMSSDKIIKNLVDFFYREYITKRTAGLPTRMSVEDQPTPTNELYAKMVKEIYANKATNYEEILKQERADEHSNRNRVHRKRFMLEGRKQKKRAKRCNKKATTAMVTKTEGMSSNNKELMGMASDPLPEVSNLNQGVNNLIPLPSEANRIAEELSQEIKKKWPEAEPTRVETFMVGGEEVVWVQLDTEEEENVNNNDD